MAQWLIPRTLWSQSLEELAGDGRQGREGICLWVASIKGDLDSTIELVRGAVLRGPLVRRGPLSIHIGTPLMYELTDRLDRDGLILVGQVHGHPRMFVDLSDVDRALGFRVPGFLSVVAPHYGTKPQTVLDECGVHEFVVGKGYQSISAADAARRVRMTDRAIDAPIIVGATG